MIETVASDGSNFDHLSGATISPRGLLNLVINTLYYYKFKRNELFN